MDTENNPKISPETELYFERIRQKDRETYNGLFSGKWVENMIRWGLYLVGAMILTAIILSAANYIK